ncbi:hypothetical protein ACIGKM_11795 [Ectopseudomonas toyotomiensis]|uniref:phage tail tube protein n=1 Tax=Ectopseudomonas toyotomiensis TaxID=554344 RepID=UPI0037C71C6C
MITVPDASLIGYGPQFMRVYQSQNALLPVGNSSELQIGHTEDMQTLPNYITGVGNRNSTSRVGNVTASYTLYDPIARNLAMMGRGTIRGVAAGPVAAPELHVCEGLPGELIPFNELPDTSVAYEIKSPDDATTYAPGTDYLITPYGIQLTSGTTITSAGITAMYTKLKADVVEMLTSAQLEFEVYFAGLNAAQGGAPTPARLRRFKPNLVQTLPLSGTQYAAYQVTGELLADMLVTEPGMSQFYSLGMKAAA